MSKPLCVSYSFNCGDSIVAVGYRPATPEEIKAAHGKCGGCKYYEPDEAYCTCPYNYVVAPQPEDYCNHHEPKET